MRRNQGHVRRRHRLNSFWLVILFIFSGGLVNVFARGKLALNQAPSPLLPPNANTYANLFAQMQCETLSPSSQAVCELGAFPVTFEEDLSSRIEVGLQLAEKLSAIEANQLKQKVYDALIENSEHLATRAKLIRIMSDKGFKFIIEDLPEYYGAGGVYEEDKNRITILYSAIKVGFNLHGALNHECHHAESNRVRGYVGANEPYISESEYQTLSDAVNQCNIATTSELHALMDVNSRKAATKDERRLFNTIKKLLSDYKPTLIPMLLRKNEAELAEIAANLKNGKPVSIGKLHIKVLDRHNDQVYAWGYHAANLTNPQELVNAYIYDNLRHINTVKAMYAAQASVENKDLDSLVVVERDAEINASPKLADFFCSPLVMYHEKFRRAHAESDEAFTQTQMASLS